MSDYAEDLKKLFEKRRSEKFRSTKTPAENFMNDYNELLYNFIKDNGVDIQEVPNEKVNEVILASIKNIIITLLTIRINTETADGIFDIAKKEYKRCFNDFEESLICMKLVEHFINKDK